MTCAVDATMIPWETEDSPHPRFRPRAQERSEYETFDAEGFLRPFAERFKTPVWRFRSSTTVLETRSPISVSIARHAGSFAAENETLGIFAGGETVEKAVEDFADTFVTFYHHYVNLPAEKAKGEALRLRKVYGKIELVG